jgi:hypothetical protein
LGYHKILAIKAQKSDGLVFDQITQQIKLMLKKCKLDDEGRMLIGGIIDNQRIWTKKFVNKIKGTKVKLKGKCS